MGDLPLGAGVAWVAVVWQGGRLGVLLFISILKKVSRGPCAKSCSSILRRRPHPRQAVSSSDARVCWRDAALYPRPLRTLLWWPEGKSDVSSTCCSPANRAACVKREFSVRVHLYCSTRHSMSTGETRYFFETVRDSSFQTMITPTYIHTYIHNLY